MTIDGGKSALAEDFNRVNTLYHGTSSEFSPSIVEKGLKPHYKELPCKVHVSGRNFAYVSTSHEEAKGHAQYTAEYRGKDPDAKPVVIHIDRNHPSARRLRTDPEQRTLPIKERTDFVTRKHIHPSAIKKVEEV